MPENKIHKLTAFVLENGAMAEKIIFHDVDEEGRDLPGITLEERQTITRVLPRINQDWLALLLAARQSLWDLAKGHPVFGTLQKKRARDATIKKDDELWMNLVDGDRANCGIYLHAQGDAYVFGAWVWAAKKFQPVAEKALEHLDPRPAANAEGTFIRRLPLPREGETYEAVGQRAAQHLWEMARPVADAILAQP
ncbi:hypothetical protein L6R52_10845 [Myxococcota bacterium]|nr:hypothetical protein [Myxococcota bacterium]